MKTQADQQAVASNLNFCGLNGIERRKNAEGDLQLSGLLASDRREAGVVEGRAPRGFCNGAIQRLHRESVADATSQAAPVIEGRKRAAEFGQVRGWRGQEQLTLIEGRGNSLVSQLQQYGALIRRKLAELRAAEWTCQGCGTIIR